MKKLHISLASLTLAALAVSSANAQIISYSSNSYVATSQNLTRQFVQSGDNFTVAASDSSALSPAANYSGPTFFGGGSSSVVGGTGTTDSQNDPVIPVVQNNANFDRVDFTINIGNDGAGSKTLTSGSFVYFKTGTAFSVTSNDQFRANLLGSSGFSQVGRFLVRDSSGNLYVSNETFAIDGSLKTSSNLTGTTWAPLNTSGPSFYQTYGSFGSLTLTGLTGAGAYYEGSRSLTSTSFTNGTGARFQEFVVVPEPSALLLMLGGFGIMALRRRRA